ncbi:uncharacterized protein LOC119270145 [Triticum dicoccoides]|uniref:uncharacterized protein LOC119270145 n=1 Tax=Triticum dicoccoides TaxID=85692 RepID=UPI00188F016A|nr:uncharacterized protein LOC119270145 [Triticum dicoccoides]
MAMEQKLMNTGQYRQESDEPSALETVNEGSESDIYSGSENMLSNVHAWQTNGSGIVKATDLAGPEGLRLISGLIEPIEPDKADKGCLQISETAGAEQSSESDTTCVRRHRRGAMPDERTIQAKRVTTLETAIRGFAERKTASVITPTLGLSYDSLTEAYDFYNLYSWECGFGIRYGRAKIM